MGGETLIILGLLVNFFGMIGGFVGLLLKFERRMTTMETHLLHVLPTKRKAVR